MKDKNFFNRLMKGKKVTIQRDDGDTEQFICVDKNKEACYLAKRIKHSMGDILELKIEYSYNVKDNMIIVPDSLPGYLYGPWHPDYESKNKLLQEVKL